MVTKEDGIRERVIEIQQEFTYTQKVKQDGIEVYECREPGTSVYFFELVITKHSIYMSGDISSLLWKHVGSRGIAFLAGDDIHYYIHSKLDSAYRDKKELDKEAVEEISKSRKEDGYEELSEECVKALRELGCNDIEQAYALLYDETGEVEWNITQVPHSVRFPLEMVCLAARRIIGKDEYDKTRITLL